MAMSLETLEFVIHADGRVEEKVTGIVGATCADVTAALESQLGIVLHQEPTSDYFAAQAQNTLETTATNQVSSW